MLAVEDDVLLGDDRHLSCSLGLAESVVCAARVDADVMYSNVLDGQSHVTKIEKCRDSWTYNIKIFVITTYNILNLIILSY